MPECPANKGPPLLDAKASDIQVATMIQTGIADLEILAADAVRESAGPEAFGRVEVEIGVDVRYRPADEFTFLINQDRAKPRAGLVRIRLGLKHLDEVAAQGDEHLPVLDILDRTDWEKRANERLV